MYFHSGVILTKIPQNLQRLESTNSRKTRLNFFFFFSNTQAGRIPSEGSLAQVQWLTLDDTDVGIVQENGKLLGRFCLPKGNAGDT